MNIYIYRLDRCFLLFQGIQRFFVLLLQIIKQKFFEWKSFEASFSRYLMSLLKYDLHHHLLQDCVSHLCQTVTLHSLRGSVEHGYFLLDFRRRRPSILRLVKVRVESRLTFVEFHQIRMNQEHRRQVSSTRSSD